MHLLLKFLFMLVKISSTQIKTMWYAVSDTFVEPVEFVGLVGFLLVSFIPLCS